MERIKSYMIKFKDKFLIFCDLVFIKINSFFIYIGKSLFLNFSTFLIVILTLIMIVFYRAIIDVLNFELFGSQFTFGDSLNNLVSLGFEASWNLMISLIRSFSPSGPIGLAFEIITETIAFVLLIIGYIIYFSIYVLNFVWYLISQFGFYNVIVILSWSYLIGLYRYIYSKIFEFINARKLKKQIKHAEKNIDLLVENENQEPGYTKKT